MAQKIISGAGSINRLAEFLKEKPAGKIFLVTGKKSFAESGAESAMNKIISGINYFRFYDFDVNPKVDDVQKGVTQFINQRCDFIVGIGGGTVIDIAKAISVLVRNTGNAEDFVRGKKCLNDKKIPTAVIPTTAGTGSESTHFSVVYIRKVKYSMAAKIMLPDYAILDHRLTNDLPPGITASTGMDALCQSIESYWSINSTDASRKFSLKAIALAMSSLVKAVNDPDEEVRGKMLVASNLSGRAINIAKTTAAHSISYPLTSYFGIPHGQAVALTLPHFFKFNNGVSVDSLQDERGVSFVKKRMKELMEIFGCTTDSEIKHKFLEIMKQIGLKTNLSSFGISNNDIALIVKNGFNPQRVKNNPRKITESQLRELLEKIL